VRRGWPSRRSRGKTCSQVKSHSVTSLKRNFSNIASVSCRKSLRDVPRPKVMSGAALPASWAKRMASSAQVAALHRFKDHIVKPCCSSGLQVWHQARFGGDGPCIRFSSSPRMEIDRLIRKRGQVGAPGQQDAHDQIPQPGAREGPAPQLVRSTPVSTTSLSPCSTRLNLIHDNARKGRDREIATAIGEMNCRGCSGGSQPFLDLNIGRGCALPKPSIKWPAVLGDRHDGRQPEAPLSRPIKSAARSCHVAPTIFSVFCRSRRSTSAILVKVSGSVCARQR